MPSVPTGAHHDRTHDEQDEVRAVGDRQQQRLYKAEEVPLTPTMDTVREFQAYVDKVLGRAYLRRTYGMRLPRRIRVADGRRRSSACAMETWEGWEIRAPRWSRSEQTALHEIAHCVHGTSRGGDHGPEFAKVYLDLVRHMLGAEAAARMQTRFRVYKVRVNDKNGNPRLPIVPPAQKEYAAAVEAKKAGAK